MRLHLAPLVLLGLLSAAPAVEARTAVRPAVAAADRHVDAARGFSIDLPEGWQLHQGQAATGHGTSLVPPGDLGTAISVTVGARPAGMDLDALVDAKVAAIASDHPEVTELEDSATELAGQPARLLQMDVASGGQAYRVEQWILVRGERTYTVQRNALSSAFEEVARELGAVLTSFAFEELSGDALREEDLKRLAAMCGSEVDWAPTWDQALERARAERKPIVLVAWLYGPFDLPSNPRSSVFMDQDVIRLVQERFVPYWLKKGEARLTRANGEPYGMGGSTFGQALMVVDADGVVRAEIDEAADAAVAWTFLVRSLGRGESWLEQWVGDSRLLLETLDEAVESEWPGNPVPAGLGDLELATLAVDRGIDPVRGMFLVRDLPGHAAAYQRARFARLTGSSARQWLDVAREEVPDEDLEARVLYDCELALELVYGSQPEEADALLAAWLDRELPSPLRARVLHDLAGLRLVAGDGDGARALFGEVVDEHRDTRWAWSSAVALGSDLFDLGLVFEPERFRPGTFEGSEVLKGNRPERPAADASLRDLAAEALDVLRRLDFDSGSYAHPTERSYQEALGANPFLDATNAIAGRALLAAADAGLAPEGELFAEVGATVDVLVASVASRADVEPVVLYMDYMTWSDGAMLELLAEAVEAGAVEREVVESTVAYLVADLAARQQDNGGWSYYKKNDLSADDVPAQSISFTSAACSIALSKVAAAGFEVPDELRETSTAAMAALRDGAGVFAYFLHGEAVGPHPPIPNPAGDVGRGPACELALYFAGASDPERLGAAVDAFLDHADSYASQQGKVLMHAGAEGQGCHYLMFDYGHAALAAAQVRAATEPDRPAFERRRARLLDLLGDCRQSGGTYLDSAINGRSYGTAMAVLAMLALE